MWPYLFSLLSVSKAHRSHRKLTWFWYTCLKGCVASYCLVISAGLPTSDSDLEWDPFGVGLGIVFICRPATTAQILSELVGEVITQQTLTSQNQVACDRWAWAPTTRSVTLTCIYVTSLCHVSADSFSLFSTDHIFSCTWRIYPCPHTFFCLLIKWTWLNAHCSLQYLKWGHWCSKMLCNLLQR